MFKSSHRPYRKRRQFPWLIAILLAVPLALVGLELLVRVIADVAGQRAELESYEGEPQAVTAYRLKFLDQDGTPYDGLANRGRLTAQRSLAKGYKLTANQQSDFWRINEQGFRDDQPVPLEKPQDEIRIFVLGGSTAFGHMSLNNQTTFTSKLEDRFNQQVAQQTSNPGKFRPDVLPYYQDELVKALALPPRIRTGRYRVVNAAVPGYVSTNEMAQLALEVLAYKPDIVVVVHGYNDLILPSEQEGADIPHFNDFLKHAPNHFSAYLTQEARGWVNQTYLVKGIQYWLLRPQTPANQLNLVTTNNEKPLTEHLAADSAELERRVVRYRNNLQHMARLTATARVPLIVAIQPEITGRPANNPIQEEQQIISQLGSDYATRVKAGYTGLEGATKQVQQQFSNVTVLNFHTLYNNFPGQAFHDAVHLTDEANTVLANRLYDAIAKLFLIQPKPFPS